MPLLHSRGLTPSQIDLLETVTFDLAQIPGVNAVVLGGSFARGTARPDSDIDIALYYAESSPPDLEAIRHTAEKISLPNHPPTLSGYYQWGPWVNGGAWIHTSAGKLDLLYRNSDQVQRVIEDCEKGITEHDYYQQPTFGFVSVIYLAETKCNIPLVDSQNLLASLKLRIQTYPPNLQEKLIRDSLTTAEFTLIHAHGFAERGDKLNTLGCLTKIAYALSQALFALNKEYYFGDKGCLEAIDRFPIKPGAYYHRVTKSLTFTSASENEFKNATKHFQLLWEEIITLAEGRYTPRFGLPEL